MRLPALAALLALLGLGFAQSVQPSPQKLELTVYLSGVGFDLIGIPVGLLAGPKPGVNVDVGASSSGYFLRATLAAPSSVSLANLNVSWGSGYVGVKVGSLQMQMPISCPGAGVLLQLDAQAGDYSAKLSKIGASSDTAAARVEYRCY